MTIKFAVRLNKKCAPRINVLRSALNESNRGTSVKKYDTMGTIQQFDADSIETFAKEKYIDGLDKMELEEGVCQLAFNKEALHSSLEDLERKTLYFSSEFNQALYQLWELGKKHNIPFCPADIMQRALLDEAIEMEYAINEKEKKSVNILTSLGIAIEEPDELNDDLLNEKPFGSIMPFVNPTIKQENWFNAFDEFDDEDEVLYQKEKEEFEVRQRNHQKESKKRIRKMTIKGKCDYLLDNIHFKKMESYLNSGELHNILGVFEQLRDELSKEKVINAVFNASDFSISPRFVISNQAAENYLLSVLEVVTGFFGCTYTYVSAGKNDAMILTGQKESVRIAFEVAQLFFRYLKKEFSSAVDKCHKNTKRQNRYRRAGWHCDDLIHKMFKDYLHYENDYSLMDYEQEERLKEYTKENLPYGYY